LATSDIGVLHERTASPLRWTVQAPHKPAPHPNLVPVRASSSRRNHKSGIDVSPSNDRSCPLTRRLTMASSLLAGWRGWIFAVARALIYFVSAAP
jgi:hypothetical protein